MKTTFFKFFLTSLVIFLFARVSSSQTWMPQMSNTDRDLESIWFVNSSLGWAVGHNGVIRFTIDGGIAGFSNQAEQTGI